MWDGIVAALRAMQSTGRGFQKDKGRHTHAAFCAGCFAGAVRASRTGPGGRHRRQCAGSVVGHSLRRHSAVHCRHAAGGAHFLAPPFRQGGGGVGVVVPGALCSGLWPRAGGGKPGACPAGRVHPLCDLADGLVHRGGRYLHQGQPARQSRTQYGAAGHWGGAGKLHGNYGGFDAADPSPDPRQRQPPAQGACGGVLHLHCLQRGGLAHAPGGPAAVPGVLEGRGFLLDACAISFRKPCSW